MKVYELEIEDLSTLGAMGSSSTVVYTKLFSTLKKAKKHAQKQRNKKITWKKYKKNHWTSGDLTYVAYNIRRVEVE